jgi:hypothetical protein
MDTRYVGYEGSGEAIAVLVARAKLPVAPDKAKSPIRAVLKIPVMRARNYLTLRG